MDAKTKLSRHAAIINAVQNVMGTHPSSMEDRIALSTKAIQLFEKNVRNMGDCRQTMDSVMDMIDAVAASTGIQSFGGRKGRGRARSADPHQGKRGSSVASHKSGKSTHSTKSMNGKRGKRRNRNKAGGGGGGDGGKVFLTINNGNGGHGGNGGGRNGKTQHHHQKQPHNQKKQQKQKKQKQGAKKFKLFKSDRTLIPLNPPAAMDPKKAKFIPPIDLKDWTDKQKMDYATNSANWYEVMTPEIQLRLNQRKEYIDNKKRHADAEKHRRIADALEKPHVSKGPHVPAEQKWDTAAFQTLTLQLIRDQIATRLKGFGLPVIFAGNKINLVWAKIEEVMMCIKKNLHMPTWLNKLIYPTDASASAKPSLRTAMLKMCILVGLDDCIRPMYKNTDPAIKAKLTNNPEITAYNAKESTKLALINVKRLLGKWYKVSFFKGSPNPSNPSKEHRHSSSVLLLTNGPSSSLPNMDDVDAHAAISSDVHLSDTLNTAAHAFSSGLVQLKTPF